MGKMNDRRFDRFIQSVEAGNISGEQCRVALQAIHKHMGKKPEPAKNQIVVRGYTEKQLTQAKQEYLQYGCELRDKQLTEFYESKLIPHLLASTMLYILRERIAAFITHPHTTDSANRDFLTKPFDGITDDNGEAFSFMEAFQARLLVAQNAELALDPDKEVQYGEYNLINEGALIHRALIKLTHATKKDWDEKRQLAALNELEDIIAQTPTPLIERQITMRAKRNFGGGVAGMKIWRIELAKEWKAIERRNPDITPRGVIVKLLETRRVQAKDANGRTQYVPKNPDSEMQVQQINSLKRGRKRAAKYRYDLMRDYDKEQFSDLTP